MNDLISIVMPSYNTAREIGDTIASIQAQTYENWELIIVDDCSTDDTDEVVASFADPRIRARYAESAAKKKRVKAVEANG